MSAVFYFKENSIQTFFIHEAEERKRFTLINQQCYLCGKSNTIVIIIISFTVFCGSFKIVVSSV